MITLPSEKLAFLLKRRRNWEEGDFIPQIDLDRILAEILKRANEFVPSASGSILIDDPETKAHSPEPPDLIFVSCFGPREKELLGLRIPGSQGVAGQVYKKGIAIMTNDTSGTPAFDGSSDRKLNYHTHNILCVPIRINQSVCGVIELVNKLEAKPYSVADLELLETFASYISSSFQNILDARQIGRMVITDALTGLFNDRYLHRRLKEEVRSHGARGEPLSVFFLDLDHFKKVNDHHGHLAGSEVLSEFGKLIESVLRHADHVAARYGGDEFVILLPKCPPGKSEELAEALRIQTESHVFLAAPWGKGGKPLRLAGLITASLGIATWDGKGLSDEAEIDWLASELLLLADKAMYESKEGGRNRVTPRPFAFSKKQLISGEKKR